MPHSVSMRQSMCSACASHHGQQQDPGMVLEEVPIRQLSRALHQEQQAAGGAICTPEAELCETPTGKTTYRKTNSCFRHVLCTCALLPLTWICSQD